MLRHCRGRPVLRSAALQSLRGFLLSPVAARARSISNKVCGTLANLLYWQASEEALGSENFERVLARAAGLGGR
jgi:hypothetical protein